MFFSFSVCSWASFSQSLAPFFEANFRRKMMTSVDNCGQLRTSPLSLHLRAPIFPENLSSGCFVPFAPCNAYKNLARLKFNFALVFNGIFGGSLKITLQI